MLGKAGQIRTVFFESKFIASVRSLDLLINTWCEENSEAEILDIKYNSHTELDSGYYNALIIYKI
jgi:hypothetical protein